MSLSFQVSFQNDGSSDVSFSKCRFEIGVAAVTYDMHKRQTAPGYNPAPMETTDWALSRRAHMCRFGFPSNYWPSKSILSKRPSTAPVNEVRADAVSAPRARRSPLLRTSACVPPSLNNTHVEYIPHSAQARRGCPPSAVAESQLGALAPRIAEPLGRDHTASWEHPLRLQSRLRPCLVPSGRSDRPGWRLFLSFVDSRALARGRFVPPMACATRQPPFAAYGLAGVHGAHFNQHQQVGVHNVID